MKTTKDRTWREHMQTGTILEEALLGSYRMVFLKIEKQNFNMHYYYRLIVFPKDAQEPILSLNLEFYPPSGTCCLGAHLPEGHDNLGTADARMLQKDFRAWAFDTAAGYLNLNGTDPPEKQAWSRVSDSELKVKTDLIALTTESFQLAHEYVDFRRKMNKKAGGILGMFRNIDYDTINREAHQLKSRLVEFREMSFSVQLDDNYNILAIPLYEYIEALCEAVSLTVQKTERMLKLSKSPRSVRWIDFRHIDDEEHQALIKCQSTGEVLTKLYRSNYPL